MSKDTIAYINKFADAVSRLGGLLYAANHVHHGRTTFADHMKEDENATRVGAIYRNVLNEFFLPLNIYFDFCQQFSQSDRKVLLSSMRKWRAGTVSRQEAKNFVSDGSGSADLDWCFAFAGVPMKELSPDEQDELFKTVVNSTARTF